MKYFGLLFWILLSLVLCLMPGPGYWEHRSAPAPKAEHAAPKTESPARPAAEPLNTENLTRKTQRPAPSQTSAALRSLLNDHRKTKELGVHFMLMAGTAFCLIRLLRARTRGAAALTLLAVLVLASSIEGLQELVPRGFCRGFALDDIGVSLLGGLFGAAAGAARRAQLGVLGGRAHCVRGFRC